MRTDYVTATTDGCVPFVLAPYEVDTRLCSCGNSEDYRFQSVLDHMVLGTGYDDCDFGCGAAAVGGDVVVVAVDDWNVRYNTGSVLNFDCYDYLSANY